MPDEITGFPAEPDLPLPHRTPGEALARAQSAEDERGAQVLINPVTPAPRTFASDARLPCQECGQGEFWLMPDGRIHCSNDDCCADSGYRWTPAHLVRP